MNTLSILIPFHDDFEEAVDLARTAASQCSFDGTVELVLVGLDPARCSNALVRQHEGERLRLVVCDSYRGLPYGKNCALKESRGEIILFLFPGIIPRPNAVEHLLSQLQAHPSWGAVAGRWNDSSGEVEKGYNIRRFPTFGALIFDLLLLNKFFPANRVKRRYKMHDFDHETLQLAEHANDCAFMIRRELLFDFGLFDESYRFGWFDQIDLCRKLNDSGRPVYYDPGAVFYSSTREPLVNRLLACHYGEFYCDEQRFIRKEFGPLYARVFGATLVIAMMLRLAFVRLLPSVIRFPLLRHFRTHVDDHYIQQMRHSYSSLVRTALKAK